MSNQTIRKPFKSFSGYYAAHPVDLSKLCASVVGFIGIGLNQASAYQLAYPIVNSQNTSNALYEQEVVNLESAVVTATRSPRSALDAPVRVDVVESEVLEKNHIRTLKQALELVPGLYLRQIHGKTGYEATMQGLSGDRVLILVDGLPISASTGSTVNTNQYTSLAIKRIEIIKGAASSLYGSSAMGGVINIITDDLNTSELSVGAEAGTALEQNISGKKASINDVRYQFSISGAPFKKDGMTDDEESTQQKDTSGLRARLSVNHLQNDGLTLNQDKWPRIKDASEQTQAKLDVAYTPKGSKKASYWTSVDYYLEDDETRYNYYVPPKKIPQKRAEDINRVRALAGGKWQVNEHELKAELLHERYDSNSITTSNTVQTTNREVELETSILSTQWDLPQMGQHGLQFGAFWQKDGLTQLKNGVSEIQGEAASRNVGEVYAQDSWFIRDDTELLLGLRGQYDSDFGEHVAPSIAAHHQLVNAGTFRQSLRASVGAGYRVPNLKERYFLFDHSNLGYQVTGNPELVPETSISYQLGWHGYSTTANRLSIDAGFFYNELEDLIQTDTEQATVVGGVAQYSYANVDSAQTYGAELSTSYTWSEALKTTLAYSYTKTKNNTTNGDLTKIPEHLVKASGDLKLSDNVQLIAQLSAQSDMALDSTNSARSSGFSLLDLKLNYTPTTTLLGIETHTLLYAGVDNVFDKQRNFSSGTDFGPVEGRRVYVGAKLDW